MKIVQNITHRILERVSFIHTHVTDVYAIEGRVYMSLPSHVYVSSCYLRLLCFLIWRHNIYKHACQWQPTLYLATIPNENQFLLFKYKRFITLTCLKHFVEYISYILINKNRVRSKTRECNSMG